MTDQPTPETDALEDSLVAQDKQYPATENSAFIKHCVEQIMAKCRALEIQLNAARAERAEHIARNNGSLLALHKATAERDALRADVARLREAIVQTIAEGGNELPEWVEAKLEKALATLAK